MIVLKANEEQFNSLNGYKHNQAELIFLKDSAGNWIVGEEVLADPDFSEIKAELEQLERIEFAE